MDAGGAEAVMVAIASEEYEIRTLVEINTCNILEQLLSTACHPLMLSRRASTGLNGSENDRAATVPQPCKTDHRLTTVALTSTVVQCIC